MNNYPKFVEVNGKRYNINTDFRVAIECNRIAQDEEIKDFERALAIIEVLYGDEAIDDGKNDPELYTKLLILAQKYLACGKDLNNVDNNEDPDMDYIEDYDYIVASFQSDYGINLDETELHWWKFFNLINGLSNSEFGNCCVLNNIRNLRNYDESKIEDPKERDKIRKAKERVALKKNKKEMHLTKEQEESMEKLNQILGL